MVAKQTPRQQVAQRRRRNSSDLGQRGEAATGRQGAAKSGKVEGKGSAETLAKSAVKARPVKKKASGAAAKLDKPSKGSFKPLGAKAVSEIFRRFCEIEPDPKGELEHSNPYTLLVAVVLSAQATDAGVNKATRALFALADTPEKMVALGEERVRDLIKTIGLFRNKAKNVVALSQKLLAEHCGQVPVDRDVLETLPGVGRKTANVVMNVAFGQPTMAVDTHVFRVANRLGLSNGATPLAVEEDLLRVIPKEYGVPAHHWLILHGRYLCKARKPECYRCPIRDICRFEDKTAAP